MIFLKKQNPAKMLLGFAYIYILLPFLIFALGWFKLYLSIPIIILLLACFWKICKDSPTLWLPEWNFDNIIKLIFIVGVIALWVYYSGIGKFVFQNTDHQYRNAIFNILVEYDWPVISTDILPGNTSKSALIYYIGFWLPSAVVGKILGLRAGYCAQALWALLGIVLVYYLICAKNKKLEVWPLAILILFSGLDIIGEYLTGTNVFVMDNGRHLEWWLSSYQFSSMTTQLFWVFNQAVPVWLCTMLIYIQNNRKNLVFILSCSMITSTLPFIGLLAITLFFIFSLQRFNLEKTEHQKQNAFAYINSVMKDTCSFQNIIGGGIIGIFSFLYLAGNLSGGNIMSDELPLTKQNSLMQFVTFLIVEIAAYVIILYKYNKKNALYYFVVLTLIIIPPIHVGMSYDFCMRASIPSLFILMLFTIDAVKKSYETKDKIIFYALILTLAIGSMTPIHEFARTSAETIRRINQGEMVYEIDKEPETVLSEKNFSGSVEDNFFFKYIAK